MNEKTNMIDIEKTNYESVVLSSKTGYIRNLKNYPFSRWLTKKELHETCEKIENVIYKYIDSDKIEKINLSNADFIEKLFLKENNILFKDIEKDRDFQIVYLCNEKKVSIIINDDDHINIVNVEDGFKVDESFSYIENIDNLLSKDLSYAFSEEFGFLTSSPTNLGTGFKCSVMLHLPALVLSDMIGDILHSISQYNLSFRGYYGESNEFVGEFFQISNEVSLGKTSEDILENIKTVILQIIEKEIDKRKNIFSENSNLIDDYIWRSYGVLSNVRRISSIEAVKLLSRIRLGIDKGFFRKLSHSDLNKLLIDIQPAHLQYAGGSRMNANLRDILRADILRNKFSNLLTNN